MSCLFQSLAPAVNLHHHVLRQTIAAYLKTDPKLLDDINAKDILGWDNIDLNAYANHMSKESTWGGAFEIKAFCELFQVDVVVHVLYTGKEFTVNSSRSPRAIVHITYNGSHFEPRYVEIVEWWGQYGRGAPNIA